MTESRPPTPSPGVPATPSARATWRSPRVWFAVLALVLLASCERTPSKSDYVSARVTALCKGKTGNDLRACRLAVIKQFSRTPLEEMKQRFPKPEPRARPASC